MPFLARQAGAGPGETSGPISGSASERHQNKGGVRGVRRRWGAASESMVFRHLDLLWVAHDLNLRWVPQGTIAAIFTLDKYPSRVPNGGAATACEPYEVQDH